MFAWIKNKIEAWRWKAVLDNKCYTVEDYKKSLQEPNAIAGVTKREQNDREIIKLLHSGGHSHLQPKCCVGKPCSYRNRSGWGCRIEFIIDTYVKKICKEYKVEPPCLEVLK